MIFYPPGCTHPGGDFLPKNQSVPVERVFGLVNHPGP